MGRYLARGIGTVVLFGWILGPGPTRSQTHSESAPQTRPNIVVIMADDLDVGSLTTLETIGYMPNLTTHVILPGMRFTNSFVTNSLCCPSRATFLTGQYAHNTGVRSNNPPDGISNFDDRSTVATWLHDAGYRTGYVGKYLNGYGQVDVTGDGMLTGTDHAYVPPGWTDWQGLLDFLDVSFTTTR